MSSDPSDMVSDTFGVGGAPRDRGSAFNAVGRVFSALGGPSPS